MRGHIRKRGNSSWAIVIDLGNDLLTGKRQQKWQTIKETKKDAERALNKALSNLDDGLITCQTKKTVAEFLLQWLKDYVEHSLSPQEVADILTDTGLEIEGIESYSNYRNVPMELVVGLVKTVQKHPDADRLTVCQVDIGSDRNLQIICGAPNVESGQKVVVANIGTELTSSTAKKFKIKKL